jgi:hypothetical protein
MSIKKIFVVTSLMLLLVLITSSVAAETDENWEAKYWNNKDLGGKAVLTRLEPELNHDWGRGSPSNKINKDYFSARWVRHVDLPAGTYRFTAVADDGVRLWVDGEMVIDSWIESQVRPVVADVQLADGEHEIMMKFFEITGDAVARLSWVTLPTPGPEVINNWRGEYFNNMFLADAPAIIRDDPEVNFDWGFASPAPSVVQEDRFSVRWTRNVWFSGGLHRFTVTADDGVRLWVNNVLLIDQWHDQGATTYSAEINLPAGWVPIRMEHYDNWDLAVAKLDWTRVTDIIPGPAGNWQGEYFANKDLSGLPAMVRHDPSIQFDWGFDSPAPSIPADNFSARWTGNLMLGPGTYRFSATTDDGVRLWVNNQLVIDQWTVHPATTFSAFIGLPGGSIPVTMEYNEHAGLAEARLHWSIVP